MLDSSVKEIFYCCNNFAIICDYFNCFPNSVFCFTQFTIRVFVMVSLSFIINNIALKDKYPNFEVGLKCILMVNPYLLVCSYIK